MKTYKELVEIIYDTLDESRGEEKVESLAEVVSWLDDYIKKVKEESCKNTLSNQ